MEPLSREELEDLIAESQLQSEQRRREPSRVQRLHPKVSRYLRETAQEILAETARGACWGLGALLVAKLLGVW